MNTTKFAMKLAIPLFVALAYGPAQGLAAPIPSLLPQLASFAVLGASDVTSASVSTIGGNLGSWATAPTASAASFNFLFGAWQPGTEMLAQGQLDTAITAFGAGVLGVGFSTGPGLNNSFNPGVYDVVGTGLLNSGQTLTLDGQGSNTAAWVFRASALTINQGSTVTLSNVGDGSGVRIYWIVDTLATLNADSFLGNVLASTITTNGSLTMECGRLLASTANVVLSGSGNKISTGCMGVGAGSGGFDHVAAIPEPETYAMLLAGLGMMGFVARRRQRNLAAAA